MTHIPLHLIETFVIFGESQNMVKAAKTLSQTQPSVTRQLENFQNYFKKPLFKLVGRQKTLTDYGRQIQNYYKKNILEMFELQSNMNNQSFQGDGELITLAARSEILKTYISPLHFQNPVHLKAAHGSAIREGMESSYIDVAVLQENFESFNYFRKKLFSSEWRLLIPHSWKIDPTFENLKDKPFASYSKNITSIYPKTVKKIPFSEFNLKFIADDWRLIADKVQQQACWAIVPQEYTMISKADHFSLTDYFKEFHFYLYFRKDLAKNKDIQNIIAQLS